MPPESKWGIKSHAAILFLFGEGARGKYFKGKAYGV
jgi:hypothetical protein